MKENNKTSRKKLIFPIGIMAVLLFGMAFTLYSNKQKINESKKPVDRTQVPVSVNVTTVTLGVLSQNQSFPALLKPFEEANLTSQSSGIIKGLKINLGDKVTKGQVLGQIDAELLKINLKSALVNLKTAEVNKRSAEINTKKLLTDYERAQDLFVNKAGLETNMLNAKNSYENSINTLDNAKNTFEAAQVQIDLIKQQIANMQIVAPISGTISNKKLNAGEFTNPGVLIATITNINTMKATAYVNQSVAYKLKLGQTAKISSAVFPEMALIGKVIFISPNSDINHNYQIDFLITQNQGSALKAGTDVAISFKANADRDALLIPKSALVVDRAEPFVYVNQNGKAKGKAIQIGTISNDQVEVLSGISAGESVIINGQINLKEGSIINIVK